MSSAIALVTAAAIGFGPTLAHAEPPSQAPTPAPVCPGGYRWDQGSGRCELQPGLYPTPLQQTTQSTYVPQSVALSGPREIRDWREGDLVPDGYRVTQRARGGLVAGGAVMFAALYVISLFGAAAVHDANQGRAGGDNADALFVPGLGPFIQMSRTTTATGNLLNMIDGLGQCAGLTMFAMGLLSPKQVLVRNDLAKPALVPTPFVAHGGGGLGLVGLF